MCNDHLVVMTYADYEWVPERFGWMGSGVFVAYVRDVEPRDVIDAMTSGFRGTGIGLNSMGTIEDYSAVAALQVDRWTIAFAPMNYAAITEEVMAPLSADGAVLSHSCDVNGHSHFFVWEDGMRVAYFDPLLRCGFGLDPMPDAWKPRMREVGIEPDAEGPGPDGKFHVIEGSFAMAANYTGVELTRAMLDRSKFALGSGGA